MMQKFFALLLQLSLFLLTAEASPISVQNNRRGNPLGYGIGGGIVGFIVLVLDIIVWIEVLQSGRPVLNKVLWAALVFLFPIGGVIIYFLFSNRSAHRGGYETIT